MGVENAAFRRKNPLTGEWVLVSPHRNNRPWLGAVEAQSAECIPNFDQDCPLCPGTSRANGDKNPDYSHTYVFDNDFAALTANQSTETETGDLFNQQAATGMARVICFSPQHNLSLPQLSIQGIHAVVLEWQKQYRELSDTYVCVQIFENKGEVMGCSQPHPHGQVWAHNHLSTEIEKEDSEQRAYFKKHNSALLADYVKQEQQRDERIVVENEDWIVLVPYWAKWPFETLLVSKHGISDMNKIDGERSLTLAEILRTLTIKYDNVFNCSFPYSMGWHNAPANSDDNPHWILHAHFYPPLLRSATVKKHMVGYEMLAESQRDLTPELAADILRNCADTHYLEGH